jgi:SPP1 gp7 family putative phage head morphogenesis protein
LAFTQQERAQIARNFQRMRTKKAVFDIKGFNAPLSIEASYLRALRRIVREVSNKLASQLLPVLKQAEPEYRGIQDSALDDLVTRILSDITGQIGDLDEHAASIALTMADRTEAFNRRKFISTINQAIGISINDIVNKEIALTTLEESVKANVELIKSIPPQYLEKVQAAVTQGLSRSDDFFSIRQSILEIGESTRTRAKLIARDQVTKLNAALTENRQQSLGITEYIWRTSNDDRVRPAHAANDGKTFAWDSPPSTGHPGTEVLCRCIAEPNLDHLTKLQV